jgi:tetratricopeptide (TPR) repeat protein
MLVAPASATKMNANPLPYARDLKHFDEGQTSSPSVSNFQRRPDYRVVEAEKKKAAEEAKKAAEEKAAKQEKAVGENFQRRIQYGLEQNNKGVAFGKAGRWSESITAHEEACKYEPSNKQFKINLSAARCAFGQERLNARDFNTAANLFRKALSAAPDNGLAGRLLSEALKKMGRDPNNAEVRIATGDQLSAVGDFEGASIEYQAAMQIEPSARTYVKIGDMALRYGQLTTATNWYRQALVKDPTYGPAHRQLGMLALAQRDYTGAGASLRKAVICDPRDAAAGQQLVEIWRRQVAQNPLLAENHLGLAGALQLTGDFAGADNEYRKLEALDPKHPGLPSGRASLQKALQHASAEKHRAAAETFFGQGLRREALAEITQAVMMEPRNAKYQFLMGETLEANGDYQGAYQAYLTCVLIDPENNREAAARMREMQTGMKNRGMQIPQVNQVASQLSQPPAQQPSVSQQMMQMQQQQMQMQPQQPVQVQAPAAIYPPPVPQKNVFEGGSGLQVVGNQFGLRTHNEAAPQQMPQHMPPQYMQQQQAMQQQMMLQQQAMAAKQQQMAAVQRAVPPKPTAQQIANAQVAEAISKVQQAEAEKNFDGAITILQSVASKYLQNSEVHHRLAVNMLAAGRIADAISEFRIASALEPANRAYAEDLARALAIHKRSMLSGDSEVAK